MFPLGGSSIECDNGKVVVVVWPLTSSAVGGALLKKPISSVPPADDGGIALPRVGGFAGAVDTLGSCCACSGNCCCVVECDVCIEAARCGGIPKGGLPPPPPPMEEEEVPKVAIGVVTLRNGIENSPTDTVGTPLVPGRAGTCGANGGTPPPAAVDGTIVGPSLSSVIMCLLADDGSFRCGRTSLPSEKMPRRAFTLPPLAAVVACWRCSEWRPEVDIYTTAAAGS